MINLVKKITFQLIFFCFNKLIKILNNFLSQRTLFVLEKKITNFLLFSIKFFFKRNKNIQSRKHIKEDIYPLQ